MNRKTFRRLRVKARIQILHGHESFDAPGEPAFDWFLRNARSYDPLAARLGGFTTDARSRLTLYPLHMK